MKCDKVKNLLGAYIDSELSRRKTKQVQQHLEECSSCSWELKSYNKIDELGQWITKANASHVPKGYWDNYIAKLHQSLKEAKHHKQNQITNTFNRSWHLTQTFTEYWIKKLAPGLATAVVIILLILGVDHLRQQSDQMTTLENAGKQEIIINLYLKEHEKAVTKVAYSTDPLSREIEIGYEDLFYYDEIRRSAVGQTGEAGVFLRVPQSSRYFSPKEPSRATEIMNGQLLKINTAQEAVNFKIVAPQTLYPGYFLEIIKTIEGSECLQLIYSNGMNTVSLFEQAVMNKDKFHSNDFREYVIYSQEGSEAVDIVGWNSTNLSFTIIGEPDFSQLLSMIREIQRNY